MSEIIELTKKLVQIQSENPTGTEREIAVFVKDWFSKIPGVKTETYEVAPDRPNVIARIEGESPYPRLACLGHMDTVPAGEGWTKNPFGGEIEQGRLYGRGATDMKGGLAVAMMALKNVALSGKKLKESFLVCATMDEEGVEMLGALDVVAKKLVEKDTFLIACEPSGLKCGVEHKGVIWYELITNGIPSHAGNLKLAQTLSTPCAESSGCVEKSFDGMSEERVSGWGDLQSLSAEMEGTRRMLLPDRANMKWM